jgi:hypothetical protein
MAQRPIKGLADMRFVQAVLEVRYPKVHRYWDASGAIIETVEQRLPGLRCTGLEEHGFRFSATPERGLSTAQFYWDKTTATSTFGEAGTLPKNFSEGASEFIRLVGQQLSVHALSFLGNRFWYVVPFDGKEQAQAWLASLRLWRFLGEDQRLGELDNDGVRIRTRIDDRIAVLRMGSGEVGRPGTTIIGVIFDMDFQLANPPTLSRLDGESVIKTNVRLLEQFVSAFFSQRPT